jgi:hypothetical protein
MVCNGIRSQRIPQHPEPQTTNPAATVTPRPDEEHPAPQSEGKEEGAGSITVCRSFSCYVLLHLLGLITDSDYY